MPTRKELLEELSNEMGNLSSVVRDASEDAETSSRTLGQAQVQAADVIASGMKEAGDAILAAAVVGGVLGLFGNVLGLFGKALGDRIRDINVKTDLINSIQSLQARYAVLSYEFIVERSFAQGASRDERQNVLNELLHDGIVTSRQSEKGEAFFIEPNSPKLIERQEWLDSIKAQAAR